MRYPFLQLNGCLHGCLLNVGDLTPAVAPQSWHGVPLEQSTLVKLCNAFLLGSMKMITPAHTPIHTPQTPVGISKPQPASTAQRCFRGWARGGPFCALDMARKDILRSALMLNLP